MRHATTAAAIAAVLSVLAVLVIGGYGARQWSEATDDNCARIDRIVRVGGAILADVDAEGRPGKSLRALRDDGLLTQAQYDRELEALKARLKLWNGATCQVEAP